MIIKNAIICDENGEYQSDIRIENSVITEIAQNIEGDETLDAKGAYFMPSLVDTNVKLKDAALNSKNIHALSDDAKKGGVGHVVLSPDCTPAIDNAITLEFTQNSLKNIGSVKVDVMLNTLKEDASLSNVAILLKRGAAVPYMSTIAKNDLAIKIAEYVKMYDVTLFCKAEDNSLINNGVMLEGEMSSKLGLAGIPDLSEVLHVSRMIEIARHFNIKILFKAIASPRSIELIDKAKKEGVDVRCEVSLHHLLHSDDICANFNTTAKLNPPLATKEDVALLIDALKAKKIDMLTSLHQPSSPVNKEVAFYDAAYGCDAISDALPLYYTKLVKSGLLSMSELVRLSVTNPAKSINMSAGSIEIGKKANAVLFDPTVSYQVQNSNSLYNGEELFGSVVQSF